MSLRPPGDRPRSAEILNLMCARFEAALADGNLDETLRAHERSCERCSDFSRDLARVEALIADATGPVDAVPEGFLDQVLLRADALDGRLGETRPSRSSLPAIAVTLVAAAAVIVAFWAGGAREQLRQSDERARVRVAPTPVMAQVVEAPEAVPTASMRPTLPPVTPSPKPTLTRPEPRVPAAAPIPEPVVDLGAEIQVMLREKVAQDAGCPQQSKGPVWVTATIQPDGSLTNRSVMSAGGASEAHRCVSRALDSLLLPPGSQTTTITFELSW